MELDKVIAEACEESKQHLLCLNVSLYGRNQGEELTCSLVIDSLNALDEAVQQFGHDIVNRLRQGLEWAYSTVRVLFLVVFTIFSRVVGTGIRWKCEGSGDDDELEQAESRAGEVRQVIKKAPRPRGSGKACSTCC